MQSLFPDERWTQVEALFQEAADLPPGSRASFLDARCGHDTELREEVLSLLRYDTRGENPLLDALQASAASVVTDEPAAGRMLGPYRIEREIGRGGMSVVYSAMRADGEFQKRVAIKLIKRGMDTHAVIERLRRERRILAALEHPAIARLLDGGTSEDGLPWIAMEYVDGLPLHRYCAERDLSIDDRCRLFDKVCDAVAYAHRGLVVHRDLKPGNILIDADGNPKLLDFGIAKVLAEAGDDDSDAPLTRSQARPLTPEYASPEQIRGGAVGTTTDIYSLGVVLYELLAGQRPQREAGGDTEKASDAALRNNLGKRRANRLSGDLDNILRKALREEPERRYLTVEQFQADLRRYLTGMPVSARPETWRYRFGKFIRRHPVGVAFALAALVAAGFVARLERAEQLQKAESERRLGELVALANTALFDVHGAIENLPGATQARLQIAHQTIDSLDKLRRDSGDDVRVLAALAAAYAKVARVQGNPVRANLGDEKGATQNYAKAEQVMQEVLSRETTPELLIEDAGIHQEIGIVLKSAGKEDAARGQAHIALNEVSSVLSREPARADARKLDLDLRLDLADLEKLKDPGATRRALLELEQGFESLVRENPRDSDLILDQSVMWSRIGQTYLYQGNLAEAAESYRKAAVAREQVMALQPEDVNAQRQVMMAYGHLGDVTGGSSTMTLGDYRGAVAWYAKAAAIADKMMAADPSNMLARRDAGIARSRIGIAQTEAGEFREALETFRQAEPILAAAYAATPENVNSGANLAFLLVKKGVALHGAGDETGAIQALRRSAELCRAGLRKDAANLSFHHMLWVGDDYLAVALASKGQADEALAQAGQLLAEVRRTHLPNDVVAPAYLARALASNGHVHGILAKRAPAGSRVAEWRAAADFFRQAEAEWQSFPNRAQEPYASDARRTADLLADAERESGRPR